MGEEVHSDEVPAPVSSLSEKLDRRMTDAGLDQVKALCENAGILTFHCLGRATEEDIKQLSNTARAAGFGFGHCRTLHALWQAAKEGASANEIVDQADLAPPAAVALSPKLCAELAKRGLQRLQPILRHCGVQSFSCLCQLQDADLAELENAIRSAGFKLGHVQALREVRGGSAAKLEVKECPEQSPVKTEESATAKALRSPPQETVKAEESFQPNMKMEDSTQSLGVVGVAPAAAMSPLGASTDTAADTGDSMSDKSVERPAAKPAAASTPNRGLKRRASDARTAPPRPAVEQPKLKRQKSNESDGSTEESGGGNLKKIGSADFCAQVVRPCREDILEIVRGTRSLASEVVKVRDRVTGKMVAARIPTAVMALLRLRATCLGKEESDQKIARMAMDVLEEQAFDPIRAVASLAPDAMLCPSKAMRVLGSGCIGVAFLEEDTDIVAKVMLEDFANQEFRVFNAFAKRGLAPSPKQLIGPHAVPAGNLYCIRMEKVSNTLSGLLLKKVPRGARHGLNPPSEQTAQKIGVAIAAGLKGMGKWGLVHGDLHLENIGLKDMDTQPSVQLIDFGRAATCAGLEVDPGESLVAGHEYDVFRLMRELFDSFEELQEEHRDELKECEKEVRELKQTQAVVAVGVSASAYQLHHARQLSGLQAHISEESKALEQMEKAYNAILSAVMKYSRDTFDAKYDGLPTVRNRKVRRLAAKREGEAFKCYFKSDLFWGGETAD
eukprot:TRINITY_DN6059_c0_g1_i1.p1 TRINITY_DN6059_c0_g1~~TRINITY_DN6059_c0_g1_i1.p1  ORF type:complete len:728 (-),score=162.76 TRINITY_DN6059_c0_g1_i1:477-2660(-)